MEREEEGEKEENKPAWPRVARSWRTRLKPTSGRGGEGEEVDGDTQVNSFFFPVFLEFNLATFFLHVGLKWRNRQRLPLSISDSFFFVWCDLYQLTAHLLP